LMVCTRPLVVSTNCHQGPNVNIKNHEQAPKQKKISFHGYLSTFRPGNRYPFNTRNCQEQPPGKQACLEPTRIDLTTRVRRILRIGPQPAGVIFRKESPRKKRTSCGTFRPIGLLPQPLSQKRSPIPHRHEKQSNYHTKG